MSMFGKIMAVFNLIGVIAIFVMAFLVYGERRAWQYTVYRYDLAMYGLPVTDQEQNDEAYAAFLDLGAEDGRTLKELFPNNPVSTQEKEVERVKSILDSKLAAVNSDRTAETYLLAKTLLPLAASNAQRESYLAVMAHTQSEDAIKALQTKMATAYPKAVAALQADQNPKKDFRKAFGLALRFPGLPPSSKGPPKGQPLLLDDDPRDPFEEAFSAAIQGDPNLNPDLGKKSEDAFNEAAETVRANLKGQYNGAFEPIRSTKLTTDQRRHAIAHLLISLDESLPKDEALANEAFSSPAFKRIWTVIGLQEMNRELNAEAAQLTAISLEQDKAIQRDLVAFANTHEWLIIEAHAAAQTQAQEVDQVKDLDAKAKAQKVLADAREKNVADSKDELARRRKYTGDLLRIVNDMTDSIHKTRIDVRDANTLNQEYVEKIKGLETKR